MKLFQYWDTPEPPEEVAGWIEGFRVKNPEMKHRLYDRDAASWFIGKHVGRRERAAFDAIAVPSMQSDYFRYCAVWARAGVYVDADFQCLEPLAGLLGHAPHSMTLEWDGHLVASLLMDGQRGNHFIRACLDLSTLNIEARDGVNAYMAAGPGAMNAVRVLADPSSRDDVELGFDNVFGREWRFADVLTRAEREIQITDAVRSDLARMTVFNVVKASRWIGAIQPAYKKTGRHWLRWRGSIYRDEEAVDAAPRA